jgi:DNA-binding NarL/FixJ family response regulator
VSAIRTVTIALSPLFRDLIVQLLAPRRRLELIAELDGIEGAEARLKAIAPELVLLGLGQDQDEQAAREIARLAPQAQLIAFSYSARDAVVFRGEERRAVLNDLSAQALIEVIDGG